MGLCSLSTKGRALATRGHLLNLLCHSRNIFEFATILPDGPFSAEVVEQFRLWVNLSWLRLGIDVLTNVLFLLAAFVPASANGTFRKLAGEKELEKVAQSA